MTFRSRSLVAVCATSLTLLSLAAGPTRAAVPENTPVTAKHVPPGLADRDGNKIADGLETRLGRSTGPARYEVVATFTDRGSAAAARSAVGSGRVSASFTLIDGFAATLTENQIRAIANRPGAIRVEQNFRVRALDDAANRDFGVTKAQTDLGVTGAGAEICIPDSGVDLGHEQLDSKAPIGWLDLIAHQTNPYDDFGHGTHVASIALGDGVGGPNAGPMKGVAPAAALSAVKVLDNTGYGDDSLAVEGVQWCAARQGVDVISLSLGSDVPSDGLDALSQAVNAAVAGGKIVVAAAGNSGDIRGSITSPGSATGAITVGAVADWSAPSSAAYASQGPYLATFSSRGPTADGRIKPDVVAPGVSIGAAQNGSTATYVVLDGTSMATPYVAGTAALLRQLQPGWTQANVRSAIEGTALDAGPAGKDNDWGAGLLDAYAAVQKAAGGTGSTAFPSHQRFTGSVPNNGTWTKNFTLGAGDLGAPIAVTVTLDGTQTCVIDLGPLGCFMYGWDPDLEAELIGPSGFAIATSTCPAGDDCTWGRQETLHATPPEAGTYTIHVYPAGDGNGAGGSFGVDLFSGPVGGTTPPPPPPSTVHVGDLDRTSSWVTAKRWRAQVTITLHNAQHGAVAGAVVSGLWTGNTTVSCTTNASGKCTVAKRFAKSRATATFTVKNVTLSGFTYAANANHDPDGESNGTLISVTRPA